MVATPLRHLATLCLGGLLLAGCLSGSRAPASLGTVPATAVLPDGITWLHRSAEYEAIVRQTYRLAAVRLDQVSQGLAAGTWAVILDADETVISNVEYQLERSRLGLGYSTESWHTWTTRRAATPLPGAAEFLTHVRARGGRIAIVTNRLQSECEDTIAVFRMHALVFDAFLCKPDGSPSDKNARFAAVERGQSPLGPTPLTVVAFIGDNILDFPALAQTIRGQGEAAFREFGVRFFLLPNPMYGSWQETR